MIETNQINKGWILTIKITRKTMMKSVQNVEIDSLQTIIRIIMKICLGLVVVMKLHAENGSTKFVWICQMKLIINLPLMMKNGFANIAKTIDKKQKITKILKDQIARIINDFNYV
jgi:hypothetical protein